MPTNSVDKNKYFDKPTLITKGAGQSSVKVGNEKQNQPAAMNSIHHQAKISDKARQLSMLHIDGVIGKFEQGNTGDCWLLSGVRALANTKKGAAAIKNSISQGKNGNVTVKLKGYGESYTFTPAQINEAEGRLSSGDDDVRVIEMAMEKHRQKLINNGYNFLEVNKNDVIDPSSPLNSGTEDEILEALTGKIAEIYATGMNFTDAKGDWVKNSLSVKETDKYLSLIKKNPNKYAATTSFRHEKGPMETAHSYSIRNVDDYSVTVVNPYDSSKDEKILKPIFLGNCADINLLDTTQK